MFNELAATVGAGVASRWPFVGTVRATVIYSVVANEFAFVFEIVMSATVYPFHS